MIKIMTEGTIRTAMDCSNSDALGNLSCGGEMIVDALKKPQAKTQRAMTPMAQTNTA